MDHLSTLRVFNFVMAVIYGIATVITVACCIAIAVFGWPVFRDIFAQDPGAPPPELVAGFLIAVFAMAAALLLVECILFVVAGRALKRGRGRTLQTVLAILTIASFPVGTAFGIYSLWVCWSHPPSRAIFERA